MVWFQRFGDRGPRMTDHEPEREGLGCLAGIVGVILLSPGLCSVFPNPAVLSPQRALMRSYDLLSS
jgi:hypothetical protein